MKEEKNKPVDYEKSTLHENDEPKTPKPTADEKEGIELKGPNIPGPDAEEYPNVPPGLVDELKEKYRVVFGNYFNGKPIL